jgi:hypothetical protein
MSISARRLLRHKKSGGNSGPPSSGYNAAVTTDNPVFFMSDAGFTDTTGRHTLQRLGSVGSTTLPNGDAAPVFNGQTTTYLQVADSPDFSIPTTRTLTVECWMRPDTTDFPVSDASGDGPMIHYVGKGVWTGDSGATTAQFEWQFRYYGDTQPGGGAAARARRMSVYTFNAAAGLGAGSFYQYGYNGAVVNYGVGQWRHVVMVVDDTDVWRNSHDGYGVVKLYIDGNLHDQDTLGDPYYIRPTHTIAPLRIGTTDKDSFFVGSVGKVAVYNYELAASRIAAHYAAMTP